MLHEKTEEEETFPKLTSEAGITLIPQSDKYITKKESYKYPQ